MIKYVQYDTIDEYGSHVTPVNSEYEMSKTASLNYSVEVANAIAALEKKPELYYVVINAMGSSEVWGGNGNADGFNREDLKHMSLRSDMGTVNDYGFKTFEYYAKLFKHHNNRPDSPSFGQVIFAHWNPKMERVELVVGIDRFKGSDIINKIERGENTAVSMGCRVKYDECLAPDTKIQSESGLIDISKLLPGDKVLTHSGTFKTVIATTALTKDSATHIKPFGDYSELSGSDNHPFLIAKKEQFMEGKVVRRASFNGILETGYVNMSDIRLGDYLVFNKTKKKRQRLSLEQATILGYYAGDGSIMKRNRGRKRDGEKYSHGIRISCNSSEVEHVETIVTCAKKCGYSVFTFTNKHRHETSVSIGSKEIASLAKKYCGEYSKLKFVSSDLYSEPDNVILSFLGGAIDSDGHFDSKTGVSRFLSTSENLARGVRRLLFEVGMAASISVQKELKHGYSVTSELYQVCIPKSNSTVLGAFSHKVTPMAGAIDSRIIHHNGSMLIPVEKTSSSQGSFSVVNIQVEEDETFQALDYVTHNCNICGNKAPTRKDYCKHAANYLGKIVDEDLANQWSVELGKTILPGTRVIVDNPKPKFFDISQVHVGADRTAYILGKAASSNKLAMSSVDLADSVGMTDEAFDKIAQSEKESDMDKRVGALGPDDIDGKVSKIKASDVIAKAIKEKMRNVVSSEPSIPNNVLNSISSPKFNLKSILSSLLHSGIIPKPREFQRIILVNSGNSNLADKLDMSNMVFNNSCCSCDKNIGLSRSLASPSLISALSGLRPSRGFLPGDIAPRAIKAVMVKQASIDPVYIDMPTIGNLYNSFVKEASGINALDFNDPKMYGIGAAIPIILAALFSSGNEVADLSLADTPASQYEDILKDTKFSGMLEFAENEKTASMVIDNLIAPLAYVKAASDTIGTDKVASDSANIGDNLLLMLRNADATINNMLYSL